MGDQCTSSSQLVTWLINSHHERQRLFVKELQHQETSRKRTSVQSYISTGANWWQSESCKRLFSAMEPEPDSALLSSEDEIGCRSGLDYSATGKNGSLLACKQTGSNFSTAMTDEDVSIAWKKIALKEIPRAIRARSEEVSYRAYTRNRLVHALTKEPPKKATSVREIVARCRRQSREVAAFWKRNEKDEKEARKKAEKDALEKKKREEEQREINRQAKKLNFLITQTELYTHFVVNKRTGNTPTAEVAPAAPESPSLEIDESTLSMKNIDFDQVSEAILKEKARRNALEAAKASQQRTRLFDEASAREQKALVSPQVRQPSLLQCTLKEYQLKGLTWLSGLYEQGINGILADEMGLGKTVQSIALMAYLAERHGIWGPFLIVTPASTLHNWQQEVTRFCPSLTVLPYWGNVADRSLLRKYWNVKRLGEQSAPFHVLVTSYQLIVSDEKHFRRMKWQYLILDEAQAIKSSSSVRWRTLLTINCRNRLLLTGTPIQNTMQELWALLHFIMPTLFDSHEEFSDWFSKEIESHAEQRSSLNETQLARLHMILKPFMLRRIKKDVENELVPKIEIHVSCDLSPMQQRMYSRMRGKISIEELLDRVLEVDQRNLGGGKAFATMTATDKTLMNLVMQLRKVCNHPELFEREEVRSPLMLGNPCHNIPDDDRSYLSGPGINPIAEVCPRIVALETSSNRDIASIGKGNIFEDIECIHFKEQSSAVFSCQSFSDTQFLTRLPRISFPRAIAVAPDPLVRDGSLALRKKFERSIVHPWMQQCSSVIEIPNHLELILKSGKMIVLDQMLPKLKSEGHRVLIYFQMTKMIDLMEEYLMARNYSYLRLDGSCKIADRRDMVSAFQNNEDVFIFLLSTRAGGLGINLTAADTVIFYDSDWNPTVDQQAMDRAHRLGQTKQVTVYRLITRDTIEERILLRAKQKGEIHKLVVASRAEEA